MRIPEATDTLNESTIPFIGILQCISDIFKASSLIPLLYQQIATYSHYFAYYSYNILLSFTFLLLIELRPNQALTQSDLTQLSSDRVRSSLLPDPVKGISNRPLVIG